MNLNLAYNSVGFYQLSKLMCIPFTIAVQRVVFHQEASRAVKLTLVPILLGVGLATVHDVSVNVVGTLFAIVAVVFTTFSQIFTQRYQAALECNALQLLYLTSPLICLGMVLLAPFFDNVRDFQAKYMPRRLGGLGPDTLGGDDDAAGALAAAGAAGEGEEGGGVAFWILVSCVLALGVNISNYLVLGKTSPLTYQVLGASRRVALRLRAIYCCNHTRTDAIPPPFPSFPPKITHTRARQAISRRCSSWCWACCSSAAPWTSGRRWASSSPWSASSPTPR